MGSSSWGYSPHLGGEGGDENSATSARGLVDHSRGVCCWNWSYDFFGRGVLEGGLAFPLWSAPV